MLVDPTRSQNMTVIGRRSAVAGDDAGAGLGGLAPVFPGVESGDRLQETLAVPQRHAKLSEVALGQIGQDLSIDFALAKCGLILTETEAAQPSPDVHTRVGRAP
jgi:hypothetical protein